MTDSFVAFDIEMPSQHIPRISAIGITAVEKGEIKEKAYYLVNPETAFDPYVVELVGITPEMVADEPTFPEIWEKIKHLMSDSVLVAHGAPGDMKTLCGCLKSYGIEWKDTAQYICTCRVGLEKYPEYEHHSLDYMCSQIGFPLIHHYALSDSEGCARLILDYIDKGVDLQQYIQEFDVIKCCNAKTKKAPRKKRNFKEKVSAHMQKMKSKKYRESFIATHPHIAPESVMGVNEALLRQYAEKLLKSNSATDYINLMPHTFYEENNLHAILVSKTKKLSSAISRINEFLPYINDTATCRLLVPGIFRKRQWELTQQIPLWLSSNEEYTRFFALEVIDRHFVTREYITLWFDELIREEEKGFLNRKKAMIIAKALIFCTDAIAPAFTGDKLNEVTRSKALQVALSSEKLSEEKRALLQSMVK